MTKAFRFPIQVFLLFTIALFQLACSGGKKQKPPVVKEKDSVSIRILFAGDLMGHMPWVNSGLNKGDGTEKYLYDTSYTYIKDYISGADYAIINLETTLNGPPYTGFPMFSTPIEVPRDAKKAGFDFIALANNHCVDRGKKGIRRTHRALDSLGLPYTGVFNDTNEYKKNYPPVIDIKGIRVAFLNYTYGTNGLKVYHPNYVNMIDSTAILRDIKTAKSKNPDCIVAVMHWGIEYSRAVSDYQERFAKLMAANGVDAVFGAHPHVVEPIRTYPSATDSGSVVPVFYSVGNFMCNQRDRYKDGGIIGEITITKVDSITYVSDFCYYPFWLRKVDAPRSYVAIPLWNWEEAGAGYNLPQKDSLLAVKFYNDTKKTIGPDIKIWSGDK